MRLRLSFRPSHVLSVFVVVLLFGLVMGAPVEAGGQLRITAVSPGHGTIAGGDSVTITGTGFASRGMVTSVTFGGIPGTDVLVVSDSVLRVTAPAHTADTVDVTVTRESRPVKHDTLTKGYAYLTTPTITAISPSTRLYPVAGMTVRLTGTGFFAGLTTDVTFNGVSGTKVAVKDFYTLTVTLPSLDAGPVTVAATTLGYGTAMASDLFTIAPQPLVVDFGCDSSGYYYSGTVEAGIVSYYLKDLNGQEISHDEEVYLGWESVTFDDPSVGTDKTVTLNGAYLYGPDAPNYWIERVNTATSFIVPRPLVVDFTVDTKTYDGTTYADVTDYSLTTSWLPGGGVVGDDEVYLAWESATFDTPDPGEGKTVTMNGAYLTGPDAGNYQIETVNTTTGIIEPAATPQPLIVDFGCDSAGYYYTGTVEAGIVSYYLKDLNGQEISHDEQVYLGWESVTFDDPSVGTGKTVTMNGAYLYGPDAPNYVIFQVNTATTDLLPRPLIVDFVVAWKNCDHTVNATVTDYSLTSWMEGGVGVVAGDEVYLGWQTATFDTPDPGEGKTVTMNEAYLYGADAASYQIDTLNTTTATIGTYLIVDFTVDLKICDGTVGADVTEWWLKTLDGHVEFQSDVPNDEDVQLRWESVTFDTPDPGEGKTVTMNGAYLYGTSTHSDLYRIYAVNTTTGTIEPPTAPQPLVVDFGCDSAYYSGSVCHADVVEYQLSDPNGQIIFGWAGEPDEDVHLGWDSTSIVDPSVGTNKTVIMNGAYLYGDDAGKYQIVQVNTSTTYVEPRPLVVDFTVDTKTYDGTT